MVLSPKLKIFHPLVTESRFTPLTAQQASKLRDELLGQGIRTVFRKSRPRKTVSTRIILMELEFKLLLYFLLGHQICSCHHLCHLSKWKVHSSSCSSPRPSSPSYVPSFSPPHIQSTANSVNYTLQICIIGLCPPLHPVSILSCFDSCHTILIHLSASALAVLGSTESPF